GDRCDRVLVLDVHPRYALGRPALLTDEIDARAEREALPRDQDDLLVRAHGAGDGKRSAAVAHPEGDHALTAATVLRVLRDRRALTRALLRDDEHVFAIGRDDHRDDAGAVGESHTAYAARRPRGDAERADIEADGLSGRRDEQHIVDVAGRARCDELVASLEVHRDQAGSAH